MSGPEWKPGDVAMAQSTAGESFLVVRTATLRDAYWSAPKGWPSGVGSDDCEYRPLVVIDPESVVFEGESDDDENRIPEIVNCLRRIAEGDGGRTWRARLCVRLADEFERQARSPKPAEPTGLGAVVVDRDGSTLVRVGVDGDSTRPWRASGGHRFSWDDIDHLTTLNDGIEPPADWEIDLLRGAR